MEEKEVCYHVPVMLHESLEGLGIQPSGVYVDVTFGGGGHSREILNRLDNEGKRGFNQTKKSHATWRKSKRLSKKK